MTIGSVSFIIYIYIYIYIIKISGKVNKSNTFNRFSSNKVSKVGDHCRGWPKGSLFDSYYTKV